MKSVDANEPLSTDRRSEVSVFIPSSQAAICADSMCGGVFLLTAGKCPGCGSAQWVLMEPAQWVRESMDKAGGEG